jgi:hypothetical protein
MMLGFLRILVLLSLSSSAYAGDLLLTSAGGRRLLLEFYTSEVCSSCPPMEHSIDSLKSQDTLWEPYILVAFHVDYWNYIGWEDRFASTALIVPENAPGGASAPRAGLHHYLRYPTQ